MPDQTVNEKSFPQTAKLQRWVANERRAGLTDVKFFARRNDDATVESFCGEVNQLLESPIVQDGDLI